MKKILLSKKQAGILALVIVLIATNISFAVIYFTRDVSLTGGVKTSGEIQVYDSTGTTIKTDFHFKDFYAGKTESDTQQFTIKNLGLVTVYVYWELFNPPTGWTVVSDRYIYEEASTTKYYLTINKPVGIWQPRTGSIPADTKIAITAGGSVLLSMDLLYSGSPSTLDTLSLTVRFSAESV